MLNYPKEAATKETPMVKFAILATLEAKVRKEHEVAAFLKSALPLVEAERGTVAWFAVQISPTTFGIFDVFHDEPGRDAHLAGEVAKALMAKASELFSLPPKIEKNRRPGLEAWVKSRKRPRRYIHGRGRFFCIETSARQSTAAGRDLPRGV
jgi:quinol monooxygenase YgiN